jgi:hypothetical protein
MVCRVSAFRDAGAEGRVNRPKTRNPAISGRAVSIKRKFQKNKDRIVGLKAVRFFFSLKLPTSQYIRGKAELL